MARRSADQLVLELDALYRERKELRQRYNRVGRAALRAGVPPTQVADLLGISRPTVFAWFGRAMNAYTDGAGAKI